MSPIVSTDEVLLSFTTTPSELRKALLATMVRLRGIRVILTLSLIAVIAGLALHSWIFWYGIYFILLVTILLALSSALAWRRSPALHDVVHFRVGLDGIDYSNALGHGHNTWVGYTDLIHTRGAYCLRHAGKRSMHVFPLRAFANDDQEACFLAIVRAGLNTPVSRF